ncbi:pathogenesis-related protein PRB1-3-like [Cucurbita moschata]|uniref:Pathogenesis-related protein PRB1-3-like n=1 Tax=Cucurbita moschata TaxID=3662 RepID=A0A6J1HBH6_CUCMO|nr:pathogenesis-related protein PRB1-3-like [Cucurbita moschata]
MAMVIQDEDYTALLPFGLTSGIIGSFIPECRVSLPNVEDNSPAAYINAHNAARAQVGVDPIKWDEKLANYSQQYVNERINDCKLVHSGGAYGENLAWGMPDLTATNAVKLWVDEKQFYDYATNSCDSGKVCGHYTQVVWRNSIRIGCARVECNNARGVLITCNYDPYGNVVGQRPY